MCRRGVIEIVQSYSEPKAMASPSSQILLHNDLIWVGMLLSIAVSGPCFDLLDLTSVYSTLYMLANSKEVWAMGPTINYKINNNVTSICLTSLTRAKPKKKNGISHLISETA